MIADRAESNLHPLLVAEPLLVRPVDAARLLGVKPRTFRKMVAAGTVPAPTLQGNRCTLYSIATLQAWVAEGCPTRDRFEQLQKSAEPR